MVRPDNILIDGFLKFRKEFEYDLEDADLGERLCKGAMLSFLHVRCCPYYLEDAFY